MHKFFVGTLSDGGISSDLATAMFRQRHEVFHERLGWDVKSRGGLEIDEFDNDDSVYVIAKNLNNQQVEASWRLRPTSKSYMLKDTFPCLLHGKAAPQSADVWEVSRFAVVNTPYSDSDAACNFGELTQDLVANTVQLALQRGIKRYVWVTSVGVERLALKLGYRPVRIGPPVRLGRVLSVAAELPIDENTMSIAGNRLAPTLPIAA